MRWERDAPTVVLSPHLDDAVLSTWSVLASPGDVQVLTICSASPAPGSLGSFDPVFGVSDSAQFMALRLAEDAEALGMVGRTRASLGFLDQQYREGPLSPVEVATSVRDTVDRISRLVAPAAIGLHPDHVAVRHAACDLARQGVPLTLYADLPYAARMGWPDWVSGARPRPYLLPEFLWREALESLPMAHHRLVPRPVRLAEYDAAQKLSALKTYATQFEALNQGPVGVLTNPEILPFELYWDVESDGSGISSR
jgi:LmbE family N-acetylglucosaminyl deacetylase